MKSLVFLGDAHLRDADPEVEAFLEFLRRVPGPDASLYLMGDLFDLWIGDEAFRTGCHTRVLSELRRLSGAGVSLVYVEGNRDYHLRAAYTGDPFTEVVEEGMDLDFGGRRIHVAHGDLVNRLDRPYRLWRRVGKGRLLRAGFRALPPAFARSLASRLERRIARTNRRHRVRFPEAECRDFALRHRTRGVDTLVLGHFHQELRRTYDAPEGSLELLVVPAWRESHRFLRIDADGAARYEAYPAGGGEGGMS